MAARWTRMSATAITVAALSTTVPESVSWMTSTVGRESGAPAGSSAVRPDPAAGEESPSLAFLPAEIWLGRVSRGHAYPIVTAAGEPITVLNDSDRPITISLRPIRLAATPDAVCSGSGELLDWASVHLYPTRMTLGPGQSVAIQGMVRMTKAKPPRTATLACLIACEPEDGGRRAVVYARLYAPTHDRR